MVMSKNLEVYVQVGVQISTFLLWVIPLILDVHYLRSNLICEVKPACEDSTNLSNSTCHEVAQDLKWLFFAYACAVGAYTLRLCVATSVFCIDRRMRKHWQEEFTTVGVLLSSVAIDISVFVVVVYRVVYVHMSMDTYMDEVLSDSSTDLNHWPVVGTMMVAWTIATLTDSYMLHKAWTNYSLYQISKV